jgi:hypothetical protein
MDTLKPRVTDKKVSARNAHRLQKILGPPPMIKQFLRDVQPAGRPDPFRGPIRINRLSGAAAEPLELFSKLFHKLKYAV